MAAHGTLPRMGLHMNTAPTDAERFLALEKAATEASTKIAALEAAVADLRQQVAKLAKPRK
jgi:hypothetical protein